MTHGTTRRAAGQPTSFSAIVNPLRGAVLAFAVDAGRAGHAANGNANLGSAIASWLTGGEVGAAPDEVPPGHGAIIRSGLTKLAVYNDENGHIHEMSAVCPHMGGIVRWNPGEKTWDCPCRRVAAV